MQKRWLSCGRLHEAQWRILGLALFGVAGLARSVLALLADYVCDDYAQIFHLSHTRSQLRFVFLLHVSELAPRLLILGPEEFQILLFAAQLLFGNLPLRLKHLHASKRPVLHQLHVNALLFGLLQLEAKLCILALQ